MIPALAHGSVVGAGAKPEGTCGIAPEPCSELTRTVMVPLLAMG